MEFDSKGGEQMLLRKSYKCFLHDNEAKHAMLSLWETAECEYECDDGTVVLIKWEKEGARSQLYSIYDVNSKYPFAMDDRIERINRKYRAGARQLYAYIQQEREKNPDANLIRKCWHSKSSGK